MTKLSFTDNILVIKNSFEHVHCFYRVHIEMLWEQKNRQGCFQSFFYFFQTFTSFYNSMATRIAFQTIFFTYIGCTQMADRAWLHGDSFCFFFCTRFQCRLLAWRPSFDMPFLNMLCKLAYVTNVGTTGFFTIKFDFYSWKMDLFDIELRLGVSRKYSVRDKLTVLNAYIFPIIYWAIAAQFYRSHRREPIDYTKIVSIIPNTDKRAKSTTYFIHLRPG